MNPTTIPRLYVRIYPAWEYELIDGQRTGRKRPRQFDPPTMRNMCVVPSQRKAMEFA